VSCDIEKQGELKRIGITDYSAAHSINVSQPIDQWFLRLPKNAQETPIDSS